MHPSLLGPRPIPEERPRKRTPWTANVHFSAGAGVLLILFLRRPASSGPQRFIKSVRTGNAFDARPVCSSSEFNREFAAIAGFDREVSKIYETPEGE
jgi:hypothetical protein